jgi:glycerol-3-phosphate O-acyltransferase / dihydroxyacetone phosphate acyltransferase
LAFIFKKKAPAPVHLIKYLIYNFCKLLIWAGIRVYYDERTVVNENQALIKGPCIVVSNHPSTVLDPFNAVVYLPRNVHFLANASLFKNKVLAWLLNHLFCIPVERFKDTGGRPLNNRTSFVRANRHLSGGGSMYIAPEGSSYVERRLRKLKTGVARIAFDAESENNFQLGLRILPVGLNYSNPTKFRSRLLTVYGEPVRVAGFRKDYEGDRIKAIRKLTAHLEEKLQPLLINTKDEAEDALLAHLETILHHEAQLPPYEEFLRAKKLLANLRAWEAAAPVGFAALRQQVFSYSENTKATGTGDSGLCSPLRPAEGMALALTLPIAAVGYVSHFLPCFFAGKINDWLNNDFHWVPTYKYIAGYITYPLFTGLQLWLVGLFAPAAWVWVYLLSLVPTGMVASWFLKNGKRFVEKLRALFLVNLKPQMMAELLFERNEIVQQLIHLINGRSLPNGQAATIHPQWDKSPRDKPQRDKLPT